jgi:hypothetical protein
MEVEDVDRCGAATVPPPGARLGVGDVLLRIGADGSLVLADDAL